MKSTICAIILTFAIAAANAHQIYTPTECGQYSDVTYMIKKAKDNGTSYDTLKDAVIKSLQQMHGYKESFVKDDADADGVMQTFDYTYNSTRTAKELKADAYESCLAILGESA